AFLQEESVEEVCAIQHSGVDGLAHAGFVVQPLLLRGDGLVAERVHLRGGVIESLLEQVRPDAQRDGDGREQHHEQSQPQKDWPELNKRVRGEIDGDTHDQLRSAPATPASEPRGIDPVTAPAEKAEASMSSRTRTASASL